MEQKKCKKCGTEITVSGQKVCANCGAKLTKPFYQKWWFWAIIVFIIIIIAASGSDDSSSDNPDVTTNAPSVENHQTSTQSPSSQKSYEIVDLQKMLNDLNENAMKAESTYQNKYVQIQGKIASFDSDGAYITIEPVNADEWNFDTVMCYIKNDSQRQFLMNKSKGDTVTIKGKITTIGEVLGYSLNIDEIG